MDYEAFAKAYKSFPQLEKARVNKWLPAAVERNEIRFQRGDEAVTTSLTAQGMNWEMREGTTVGPGQISVKNIHRLLCKYPQLTDAAQGGIDPKHPIQDALKPDKAAWLVTAYLAEVVDNANGKPISQEALLKAYNPHANIKSQLKYVGEQLDLIKKHHGQ
jgi:hypothetical protein